MSTQVPAAYKVRLNKRQWRLLFVRAQDLPKDVLGACDHPPGRHPTIRVKARQSRKLLLDTTIHECLHAALPQLDEETITLVASDLTRVLIRLNCRIEF
jgi:hypothetical protein